VPNKPIFLTGNYWHFKICTFFNALYIKYANIMTVSSSKILTASPFRQWWWMCWISLWLILMTLLTALLIRGWGWLSIYVWYQGTAVLWSLGILALRWSIKALLNGLNIVCKQIFWLLFLENILAQHMTPCGLYNHEMQWNFCSSLLLPLLNSQKHEIGLND
jgi:hypothetical protein